ncbi:MAG TPA: L-histidine N(alpha)-methyltransferase [Acidimicrobiales bacterium]|nr:L-histidine N(alpha)-methyltransferase [Acidimicrobiales bacterium]
MSRVLTPGAVTVDVRLTADDLAAALRRDVRDGLGTPPRTLPPTWFYDDRGCDLYEQITKLPEYYPFRTEQALLRRASLQIAQAAGASVLVELGSGNSEKTHELLAAMARANSGLTGFVAFDVAEATLRSAAAEVAAEQGIDVHAVVGDFRRHLDAIPADGRPRLVAFLGSTIGNFAPDERREFLSDVGAMLAPSDRFLLATDLVKPVPRLVAAYDDAAGVTAAFNRNLLDVLNRELGADFVPERFTHVARWNAESSWMEMRLRSDEAATVTLPAVDMVVELAAGEEIRTEISAKFTPKQVAGELGDAGMRPVAFWSDPAGDYLLTLARPEGPARPA